VTLQVWYFSQNSGEKKIVRIVLDEFSNFLLLSSALKYFSVVISVVHFAFFIDKEAGRFAQLPFVQS